MERFTDTLHPALTDSLLDVGGYPAIWTERPQQVARIECLNIDPVSWDATSAPEYNIEMITGDGCALPYADRAFDIVYSNSVIEHVGDWSRQKAFAEEVRRVGARLWIQVPAMGCPFEPHYLACCVHWFPRAWQPWMARWLTLWGWLTHPSKEKAQEVVSATRLLTRRQVGELFPDCQVYTEKMLGCLPKSYVAYRV
jgi:ubiquinone/menaquinone biosynthesis C-methylase UbiE